MALESKQSHRRMLKMKVQARAPETPTPSVTQIIVTETANPTNVPLVSGLPATNVAIAGVVAFLVLALLLVGGCCYYRRRNLRIHKKAPSTEFDPSAFAEKKIPYSPGLEYHLRLPITPSTASKSPTTASTASESESQDTSFGGWNPQYSSNFRVTNEAERSTYLPTQPKAVAEKRRPSQRTKPTWISTSPEDFVRSPPPSYDIANGSPGFLVPIPSQLPPQKSKATPTPPTPPATRSHSSSKRATTTQTLIAPPKEEYPPIASPARSESFAPKDFDIPVHAEEDVFARPPPAVVRNRPLTPPSSGSSSYGFGRSDSGFDSKTPRMMTVIAQYTPTLTDELCVNVGDTVRLLQEYKDGWGFAQYVGKVHAQKGVVPLVCLQERRRMVPSVAHKTSSGSMTSLNGWR